GASGDRRGAARVPRASLREVVAAGPLRVRCGAAEDRRRQDPQDGAPRAVLAGCRLDVVDVAGRTFLVTGGGSGLGAATAALLAGEGANVIVADLQPAETGRFVETDVLDEASVQRAVETAVDELGGLHGVVNCAGIGGAGLVVGKDGEPFPLDAFRRVVEVNLVGTFNVIRLAAAAMAANEPTRDGERGVIVNTASNAA